MGSFKLFQLYLLLNKFELDMLYERYIEIGRVCYVRLGEHAGKTCVIVDLVDQKHLLVDGPTSGVPRCVLRMNQVAITNLKVKIGRSSKTKKVRTELEKEDIAAKFAKTGLYKKAEAKKLKASLSDFERFKSRVAKTQKNRKIRSMVRQLKKKQS